MARTKIDKALLDLSGVLSLTGGTLSGNLTTSGDIFFSTSGTGIAGTSTNDNASQYIVGEYVESRPSITAAPATGVIGDLTSIALTAGDWDISAIAYIEANSATWSEADIGITTTTGNSGTGRLYGVNWATQGWANTSVVIVNTTLVVPVVRASLASLTTYYLKMQSLYTLGTPRFYGSRLSARRVR